MGLWLIVGARTLTEEVPGKYSYCYNSFFVCFILFNCWCCYFIFIRILCIYFLNAYLLNFFLFLFCFVVLGFFSFTSFFNSFFIILSLSSFFNWRIIAL